MLRNTCERMNPLNGLPIKNIIISAPTSEIITPILEWLSLTSYGSLYIPETIEPPAIPEVIVEATPAKRKATAKTTDAFDPSSGSRSLSPAEAHQPADGF